MAALTLVQYDKANRAGVIARSKAAHGGKVPSTASVNLTIRRDWAASLKAQADPRPVPPPPERGDPLKRSESVYAAWIAAWCTGHGLLNTDAGTLAAAASVEGVLAQVCGSAALGTPTGIYAALGDWSLYTDWYGESGPPAGFIDRVYVMGKLVGSQNTGDPAALWPFAQTFGVHG